MARAAYRSQVLKSIGTTLVVGRNVMCYQLPVCLAAYRTGIVVALYGLCSQFTPRKARQIAFASTLPLVMVGAANFGDMLRRKLLASVALRNLATVFLRNDLLRSLFAYLGFGFLAMLNAYELGAGTFFPRDTLIPSRYPFVRLTGLSALLRRHWYAFVVWGQAFLERTCVCLSGANTERVASALPAKIMLVAISTGMSGKSTTINRTDVIHGDILAYAL